MQFPTPSGTGRGIVNGVPQDISWAPSSPAYNDGTQVTLANGRTIQLTDYDDRLDFHVAASDDGNTYYNTMVLLEPGEADPAILPTSAELRKDAHQALEPLYNAVTDEQLDPDDLNFARILFTNPDTMCRVINKYGSIEKGRKAVIEFLLTHKSPL